MVYGSWLIYYCYKFCVVFCWFIKWFENCFVIKRFECFFVVDFVFYWYFGGNGGWFVVIGSEVSYFWYCKGDKIKKVF